MKHLTPAAPTSNSQPTLTEVLAALDGKDLSALRRRDLASAVRRVARMAGLEPHQVPLELKALSAIFERGPANGKIPSPKTVQNLRSDLLAAIDMSGLKLVSKSTRLPLSPDWQRLHNMIPSERVRIGLSRFMSNSSARGIAPECVTDATVADFCSAVASGSLKTERQIRRLARDIPRLWNEALTACPAWPQHVFAVPDRRRRSRFKQNLESLPGTLSADLEEWLDWCAVPDPLDANARLRRLAPRTISLRREQVLAAVTAALDEGFLAERLTCLDDLVEIDAFKTILTRLHRNAGGKPNAQAQGVALTLVSLAQEWAKVPPEHLQELKRLRARLPALPNGLVAKNRALLRQFEDPDLVHKLLNLPSVLWREAVSRKPFTQKSMVKSQLAIALAIQLTVPLRPRNLYALSFERHIHEPAGMAGPLLISIPPEETKTRIRIDSEVSGDLAVWLRQFRNHLVPSLTGRRPDQIFARPDGVLKHTATLASQLRTILRKRLGIAMSAHQFRHLAAKLSLDANPACFETVRQLLGHTSLRSTINAYAGIDTRRAGRAYSKLIEELREQNK
jgi:integrase